MATNEVRATVPAAAQVRHFIQTELPASKGVPAERTGDGNQPGMSEGQFNHARKSVSETLADQQAEIVLGKSPLKTTALSKSLR